MKENTKDYLENKFSHTPKVDFNSFYEDEENKCSWFEDLDTPFINNLPKGTVLLSRGTGSQDAGTFLVKTPEGQYFLVDEDSDEPQKIENTDSSKYNISILDEYSDPILELDVDFEDLVVFLNSDLTNQDFGQMIEVNQDLADKYPL